MQVLIPAGGRGSRLRPLTDEQPKPLLPLGNEPILSRIVSGIPRKHRITVIVTEELAPHFREWKASRHPDRSIEIFVEKKSPEGQRGPVAAISDCIAERDIQDDLLIMMGDSVHPFRYREFLSSKTGGSAHLAAYALPERRDASRFGVVEVDAHGMLASFEEKPPEPRSNLIFTGCFHLPSRLLGAVREIAAIAPPQMGFLIAGLLQRGERIGVHRFTGEWHDIGTFESYLQAHAAHMSRSRSERLMAQGNVLEGVVYVHPTARVSGSILRNCVVYEHTVIRNAHITDCVIRPNVLIRNRVVQSKLVSHNAESAVHIGGVQ